MDNRFMSIPQGHGVYAVIEHGSIGLLDGLHDGARRCVGHRCYGLRDGLI